MLTQDGLKPILEIEPGDEVIGYVEVTGETGSFPVTDTIHHTDPEIVLLTINDELLETTTEHPFYTDDGLWVNAADLVVGEQVYSFSGVYGTVESVQVVSISQEMYNLTVDTAHTFFVGESSWLVHNQDPNPSPYYIRIEPGIPGRPSPYWSIDTVLFNTGRVTQPSSPVLPGIGNNSEFWQAWKQLDIEMGRDTLSAGNHWRVNNSLSPKVDEQWITFFPEHADYDGNILVHHHVEQGRYAIPVPEDTHRGMNAEWHPRPQTQTTDGC